jgi:hypothetical protein
MEELMNGKGAEGRELILGFDAGCGTCSEIASRVQERVGDRLAVRNLNDPELVKWREEALGKDAKWAPTLFEVGGGTVRAWTGRKMALPMSRRLGLTKTWQLMQVLGEVDVSSKLESSPFIEKLPAGAAEAVRDMSRGQFLRGVGGAAVAMSVLSGVGGSASPALAATANPYDIIRTRKLTGTELVASARRVGLSADVRTLVGQALSTPAQVTAAKPVGYLHYLRNGTTLRTMIYTLTSERALAYTLFSYPPKGKAPTQAKLYQRGGNRITLVKISEGGVLWRKIVSSSRELAEKSSRTSPLGECPPAGSKPPPASQTMCGWVKVPLCADWKICNGWAAIGAITACWACAEAVGGAVASEGGSAGPAARTCISCGGATGGAIASCCAEWCWAWAPANCM